MYKLKRRVTYKKDHNKVKYFIARMGAIKKSKKTIYVDDVAYLMDLDTGEILRPKKRSEIKASIFASARRAEEISRDIVEANEWEYFVTLTFSDKNVDRHDDVKTLNAFQKWRRNIRRKFPAMFYWGAPERHEDGAIHFHFLVGGVTEKELGFVDSGKRKDDKIIYNITAWKYGFSTAVKITGDEAQAKVCNYVMKYIQKSVAENERGKKRYWYSKTTCNKLEKEDSEVDIDIIQKRLFQGTDRELIDARISVYDVAAEDIPFCLLNQIQYCDFSKNYLVLIDYERPRFYPELKRLFENGRLDIV